jgi:hypothetical protein
VDPEIIAAISHEREISKPKVQSPPNWELIALYAIEYGIQKALRDNLRLCDKL